MLTVKAIYDGKKLKFLDKVSIKKTNERFSNIFG